MKEKITLHAVHCLSSMLQITILYDKYEQSFKHHFEIELIFLDKLQLYCLESNLFLHANPWKCKNRTFFSFS